MELVEIIKDAFIFPSKNLGVLAIYSILSILVAVFVLGAMFSLTMVFVDFIRNLLTGLIYLVLSIVVGFILSGYQIALIKSGINFDEKAPDFEWKKNLYTGAENLFISIIYYTLPTLIVLMVGCYMNIPGHLSSIAQKAIIQLNNTTIVENYAVSVANTMSPVMIYLLSSLIIMFIVAIILFVIASILVTMAQARLANTGNVDEASNVPEAINDLKRIGIGNVIGLLVLIVVITVLIETFLSAIFNYVPFLSILSVIIMPYLTFFAQRAVGLLYSDIT